MIIEYNKLDIYELLDLSKRWLGEKEYNYIKNDNNVGRLLEVKYILISLLKKIHKGIK